MTEQKETGTDTSRRGRAKTTETRNYSVATESKTQTKTNLE